MKQTKRLAGLLLAVTVLCMFSALNCPAAEIGTQDFITNGGFEEVTSDQATGWNLYNSNHSDKKTWSDILKTDGASGEGNNYISIEAEKSDNTCNSGVKYPGTAVTPGSDLLLTLRYKSSHTSAAQIQYSQGVSDREDLVHHPSNVTLPSTDGAWKEYSVLIPAHSFTVEGEATPVYADTVGFMFYNVARLAKDSEGNTPAAGDIITFGFDSISLHTYTDEGLIKNGDFTLGSTGWTPTINDTTGTVSFEDGMLKIIGSPSKNYASAAVVPNDTLLPDGITLMRYRLSFKYKAIKNDGSGDAATISGSSVGMNYTYPNPAGGKDISTYMLRNHGVSYPEKDLGNDWKECVFYTRNKTTESTELTSATANKVGVQLKGLADCTIWYDDVELTALPVYVQTTTDDGTIEGTSVAAGDKIKVSAVAANRTESAVTPQLYIAFFSEGTNGKTLLSMETVAAEAEVAANTASIIEKADITVPAAKAGETLSMKVYVWSGSGLVPLGDTYALSEAVSAS